VPYKSSFFLLLLLPPESFFKRLELKLLLSMAPQP
jgi:hypothetical protein